LGDGHGEIVEGVFQLGQAGIGGEGEYSSAG
jgi:hypothetical protein